MIVALAIDAACFDLAYAVTPAPLHAARRGIVGQRLHRLHGVDLSVSFDQPCLAFGGQRGFQLLQAMLRQCARRMLRRGRVQSRDKMMRGLRLVAWYQQQATLAAEIDIAR